MRITKWWWRSRTTGKKKLKGKKNVCLGIAIYMRRNLQPIDWLRALLWNATGARLGLDPQVFSSSPSFFVFLYIFSFFLLVFVLVVWCVGRELNSYPGHRFLFLLFFCFFLLNFLFLKHNHQNNHNRNHKDILFPLLILLLYILFCFFFGRK